MRINKKHCLIFICTAYCLVGFAQHHPAPKSYIAYQTPGKINIDGKADEVAWAKALWSHDFTDIEGEKTPKYHTNVKMLWDEKNLYFYAKMEEPHIWATLKQRDTVIFYNNDFEIFIDPTGDTHNYYELEMNALNTVWDLFIVKPYREFAPVLHNWDIQGLKTAVYIDGTLNQPDDKDNFWSVEVAIPWEVLNEANLPANSPENEFWRINFSRVNWDHDISNGRYSRKKDKKGEYFPEYNWVWSPQWVINMHEPEKWGYVYFSSKEVGDEEDFLIPEDEELRWFLYELYRKQKKFYSKNGKWAASVEILQPTPVRVNGHEVTVEYERHFSGWNILVVSPFTQKTFIIREDGKIKIIKNQ